MEKGTRNVYRVCKKREIRKVLKNDFNNLGEKYFNNKSKHMIFFNTKNDALRLSSLSNKFLCAYSIPNEVLDDSRHETKYIDRFGYHKFESVEEFVISSDKLNVDNIVSIEELNETLALYGYLSYLSGKNIDDCVKVLYKKQK